MRVLIIKYQPYGMSGEQPRMRFYVPLTASLMMLRYLKSAEKVSGVSSW